MRCKKVVEAPGSRCAQNVGCYYYTIRECKIIAYVLADLVSEVYACGALSYHLHVKCSVIPCVSTVVGG